MAKTAWSVIRRHLARTTLRRRGAASMIFSTVRSVTLTQDVRSRMRRCSNRRPGGSARKALSSTSSQFARRNSRRDWPFTKRDVTEVLPTSLHCCRSISRILGQFAAKARTASSVICVQSFNLSYDALVNVSKYGVCLLACSNYTMLGASTYPFQISAVLSQRDERFARNLDTV